MAGMLRLGFSSSVRAISSKSRISYALINKAAALSGEKPAVCERPRYFSTEHDSGKSSSISRKVVEAIQSEIKANRGVPLPPKLPFTIEDDPKFCHIMLRRDYYGEKIEVTVNPVHDEPVKLQGEDKEDGRSSKTPSESVVINVSITRDDFGTFTVGANVSADKIVVTRMSFTEPDQSCDTHYVEAEGKFQRSMCRFLKRRGIKSANVGFLYNYMIEKRKDVCELCGRPMA